MRRGALRARKRAHDAAGARGPRASPHQSGRI